MTTPTIAKSTAFLSLTERGRVRAVLVTLEARWPDLTLGEQGRALELLAELAAIYRGRTRQPADLQPVSA
jgi:hypothetical protein